MSAPQSPSHSEPEGLWARLLDRQAEAREGRFSLWDILNQRVQMVKARPRLRADLVISQQPEGETVFYVIKDPQALTYYRFKENEYFILTLLDGHHEVRDLVQAYTRKYRPIRPETVEGFLGRVEGFGLLVHGRQNLFGLMVGRLEARVGGRLTVGLSRLVRGMARLNYTVPDTDRFTQWLYRWTRFAFNKPLTVGWMLLATSGLLPIVLGWSRFKVDVGTLLTSGAGLAGYVVALYAALAVVIVFHELAHALTCVHYGGHVHKMGVMLIYVTLAAYADTSDAWLFPSRWQRAAVSLAGPLSTLVFAALGAWAWWLAPAGSVFSHLSIMLVLATVPLTFANLNPFLEYDGYYVLSDLTGIPNLRRRSFEYWGEQLSRVPGVPLRLFSGLVPSRLRSKQAGDSAPERPVSRALVVANGVRQQRFFLAYGALAAAYLLVFVVIPLALQLSHLVQRFGPWLGGILVLVVVLLFGQRYIRALIECRQARAKAS
ncbi:MAG: M50 family metallopeptidase [Anaerolineae bacterium]